MSGFVRFRPPPDRPLCAQRFLSAVPEPPACDRLRGNRPHRRGDRSARSHRTTGNTSRPLAGCLERAGHGLCGDGDCLRRKQRTPRVRQQRAVARLGFHHRLSREGHRCHLLRQRFGNIGNGHSSQRHAKPFITRIKPRSCRPFQAL